MRLNESGKPGSTTRDALRAVAEELFAEHGIDGVTTRALAERAGANMAAVNYHYGNKDNLTMAVFRDVARRTVQRRLDNLARIEARAEREGRAPGLREVVEAFVDAYVNHDSPRTGVLLAHLVLQHRVRSTEWTEAIVREELDDFARRYVGVLRRAVPHLDESEVHWRYHLMVGAVMMGVSGHGSNARLRRLSNGLCAPEDRDEFREQLIAFLVASFGPGPATDKDIDGRPAIPDGSHQKNRARTRTQPRTEET
ncbi:TetR/AcrR family transcriptional regulator [Pukyongiella litopenaei]|uniref:TetR/AcrR family transcriptional regulator n=1 Tax=Pukyongiella litopenaei TaxID=2605946 RepID=A0A2S0MS39_9RHOB|nr:TetR/AcrR family transcriptional regulator [Pukyongiella litopenaei]AVO38705.1 TetR/AcrR family transcriptional regulator [Pukyongiella litopenaei]